MKKFVIMLAAVAMSGGCAEKIYQTEYRDRVQYDSITERDSVFVYKGGDTVYVHRDRWRDRYHRLHDTVRITDSIPYPVDRPVKYIPAVYRWSFWAVVAGAALALWRIAVRLKIIR